MRILSKNDVLVNKSKIVADIAAGAVFIYPTDTIYGLGCDATDDHAVRRVRQLKGRYTKPFSVIAPSLNWIKENCELSGKAMAWLVKLPARYTLILPLKNPNAVCAQTNAGLNTLGVRIPDHWIFELVSSVNKPLITTSVNVVSEPPATSREELERFAVDFIVYEGEKPGRPSTIVDLTKGERVLER